MSRRFALRAAVAGLVAVTAGCDSGSPTNAAPEVAPIASLTVDQSEISTTRATVSSVFLQIERGTGQKTPVSLFAHGLPSGVDVQFTPSELPSGSGSVTVKLLVGPAVVPGSHTVTLEARTASLSESVELSLSIYQPELALVSAPSALNVPQSLHVSVNFQIARVGDVAPVQVALLDLPERVSATFKVLNAAESIGTIVLSAEQFALVGEYNIRLRALASNTLPVIVPIRLSIVPGGPSEMKIEPVNSTLALSTNQADSIQLRLLRSGNFADSVRLELHGATDIQNAGFEFEIRQPSALDSVATIVFRNQSSQPSVRSVMVRAFDMNNNVRAISNFTIRKE